MTTTILDPTVTPPPAPVLSPAVPGPAAAPPATDSPAPRRRGTPWPGLLTTGAATLGPAALLARRAPGRALWAAGALAPWAYLLALRPRQLRWGTLAAEAAAPLPGDDVVARPTVEATRAVTITAPPEGVWPWIVQIGYGRAGFYSYAPVERALGLHGLHNTGAILPEFQHLAVGDAVPQTPAAGWTVRALDAPRSMVWAADDMYSWAWALQPLDGGWTRLIVRTRIRYPRTALWTVFFVLQEAGGEFAMMRRMLLGIKARAERAAMPPDPP